MPVLYIFVVNLWKSQASYNKCITDFPHLEAIAHCLAEPDMFLLTWVIANVPVLLINSGLSGIDTGFSSFHVAEDLDGIKSASLVGVNPVFT